MNFTEKIRKEYAGLIFKTVNRYPENSDSIHFDKFLQSKYPHFKRFISEEDILAIKKHFYTLYGSAARDEKVIKENGTLRIVRLVDLEYFQRSVGIIGPRHTSVDEPLSIAEFQGRFILINGYHRILLLMINGTEETNAYVLPLF
jgi:hypothetical protein